MKFYDNPACCGLPEFNEDLERIKYIKRLLKRYKNKGILKERLILNHIIIVYNIFGPEVATRILFFKLEQDLWIYLKTFLAFLNFIPDRVFGVSGNTIDTTLIKIDLDLYKKLKAL